MDAITKLRSDHRKVESLFKRFEKTTDRATTTRKRIVAEIIEELSAHAAVEEQVFYPAVRQAVPSAEDVVLEGLEEHHIVKWTLSELEGMSPEDERFEAKVTVLMESVRHHIEEEEGDMFPQVRKALGRKALAEMGEAMELALKVAPTRPHPRAPDTPPGNLVAGTAAGLADKARSAGKDALGKATKAARGAVDKGKSKKARSKKSGGGGKGKGGKGAKSKGS